MDPRQRRTRGFYKAWTFERNLSLKRGRKAGNLENAQARVVVVQLTGPQAYAAGERASEHKQRQKTVGSASASLRSAFFHVGTPPAWGGEATGLASSSCQASDNRLADVKRSASL
jgi:hypothetical protein